ncbi:hypothetical protein [Corynebacterium pseudotuberculosis]|uniref:hypothetical protein n=1 Tax=Corynebacterium pseudotuberculosis TaxID=1719 RepID=UPI000245A4B6|nr:hypothetical protein [Corynebacterium pseudotuberculosis]AEX40264.1 Hypothetical protein Cp3995_1813 [Corynebacterium pseudotuberculosis 3/99-5]AIG05974.1 hypothetical protein CPTA_00145 [Corynebacterium pseudotuberculosis]AIG09440.1 hypothetical protein CPTB_01384 [Corynebacterium pseudotuberculosis]AIG11341.1 hypothetical protein CPTC_01053 [Corynebacterium pseudotuberculosis]AKC74533.1 Hypothetical protein Cp226_1836 [Corynebacterium pseudotuberculosis]
MEEDPAWEEETLITSGALCAIAGAENATAMQVNEQAKLALTASRTLLAPMYTST